MDKEVNTITPADYEALLKLYDQWEREYLGADEGYCTFTARMYRFAFFEGAKAFQSLRQP